ncbi:unnamed protein product [Gongylonema pulchrum]|uniref:Uncharacterized protein n=1 Tax=Gongylonema pulchrum TaxID=637853 RepID=A0A183D8A6_9BILA|nr:unnamed protein product [Gongylonema pulchrum]
MSQCITHKPREQAADAHAAELVAIQAVAEVVVASSLRYQVVTITDIVHFTAFIHILCNIYMRREAIASTVDLYA